MILKIGLKKWFSKLLYFLCINLNYNSGSPHFWLGVTSHVEAVSACRGPDPHIGKNSTVSQYTSVGVIWQWKTERPNESQYSQISYFYIHIVTAFATTLTINLHFIFTALPTCVCFWTEACILIDDGCSIRKWSILGMCSFHTLIRLVGLYVLYNLHYTNTYRYFLSRSRHITQGFCSDLIPDQQKIIMLVTLVLPFPRWFYWSWASSWWPR